MKYLDKLRSKKENQSPEDLEAKAKQEAVQVFIPNIFKNPKTLYNVVAGKKGLTGFSLLGNITSTISSAMKMKEIPNEELFEYGLLEAIASVPIDNIQSSLNEVLKAPTIQDKLKKAGIETIPPELLNSIVAFAISTITNLKTLHPQALKALGQNLTQILSSENKANDSLAITALIFTLTSDQGHEAIAGNTGLLGLALDNIIENKDLLKDLQNPTTQEKLIPSQYHGFLDIMAAQQDYLVQVAKTLLTHKKTLESLEIYNQNQDGMQDQLRDQALSLATDTYVQAAILKPEAIANIIDQTLSNPEALMALAPEASVYINIASQNREYIANAAKALLEQPEIPEIINIFVAYRQSNDEAQKAILPVLRDQALSLATNPDIQAAILQPKAIANIIDQTLSNPEALMDLAQKALIASDQEALMTLAPYASFYIDIASQNRKYLTEAAKALLEQPEIPAIINTFVAYTKAEDKTEATTKLINQTLDLVTDFNVQIVVLQPEAIANIIYQTLSNPKALMALAPEASVYIDIASQNREYIANAAKALLEQPEIPAIINTFVKYTKADKKEKGNIFPTLQNQIVSLIKNEALQNALLNEGLKDLVDHPVISGIIQSKTDFLKETLPVIMSSISIGNLQDALKEASSKQADAQVLKSFLQNSIKAYSASSNTIDNINKSLTKDQKAIKKTIDQAIHSIKDDDKKKKMATYGIDGEFAFRVLQKMNDPKKLEAISKTLDKMDLENHTIWDAIQLVRNTKMTGFLLSHVAKSYVSYIFKTEKLEAIAKSSGVTAAVTKLQTALTHSSKLISASLPSFSKNSNITRTSHTLTLTGRSKN